MEKLFATTPVRVRDVVLIPVQRCRVEVTRARGQACYCAFSDPRAIIVIAGGRSNAFGIDGTPLDANLLLEQVTGLSGTIAEVLGGE